MMPSRNTNDFVALALRHFAPQTLPGEAFAHFEGGFFAAVPEAFEIYWMEYVMSTTRSCGFS
jgi:hypothetical protein